MYSGGTTDANEWGVEAQAPLGLPSRKWLIEKE